jgi:hypothetical protein
LVVVYRALRTFDEAYGNVTLAAATLQAGPSLPEPEPVQILNPKLVAGQFTFSFYARSNTYYSVEKAEALTPAAWTPISCVVGNGEVVELTNQVGTALEGYYRVRSQ